MAESLLAQAVALVAPPRCLACRAHCAAGDSLCGACLLELDSMPAGCPAARRGPALATHFAALPMAGPARELVHALKYGGAVVAAREMARLIAARAPREILERALLVPVPAHPRRRRERGYNQSALIAHELAAIVGLRVADCLVRAGAAAPQTGQSRGRRLELDPSAIVVRPPSAAAAKSLAARETNVLLLDDVSTTGVTLEICASAIGKRTAARVGAVTFAGTSAAPGTAHGH